MGIMEPIKKIIYAIIGAGSNSSQKIIEASGEYLASAALDEDVSICQERSRLDAINNAMKLAESLVVEIARVRKKRISHEKIQAVTSKVLNFQGKPIFESQPSENEKMIQYICRLKIMVKEGSIIGKLRQNAGDLDETAKQNFELKMIRSRIFESMKDLQAQIESAADDAEREKIREERKKLDNAFKAAQFYELGYKSIEAKKYPEAVENFSKAIELNPLYSHAYNGRGIANRFLNKTGAAMEDFDRIIDMDPNYTDVYINRGQMFSNLKRFDLAVTDYDRAIINNPNSVPAYYNRGIAYETLGKKSQAIADFQKVLELSPDHDGAQSHLSKLHK